MTTGSIEYVHAGGRVLYELVDGEERFFELDFGGVRWYPFEPSPEELTAARWLRRERPNAYAFIRGGEIILKPPRACV